MKKLLCVLAVVAVLMGSAWAEGDSFNEVLWTEYPGHYFHYYENCTILEQESAYYLLQGSQEQAVAAGRNTACLMCCARKFNGVGMDPVTAGQYLLSGMSEDDLVYFSVMCKTELLRRRGESFDLDPGIYTVGQDLPAGYYRIEMIAGVMGIADFKIFNSVKDYQNQNPGYYMVLSQNSDVTSVGKVYLGMDNVLYFDGKMNFTPYSGVDRVGP